MEQLQNTYEESSVNKVATTEEDNIKLSVKSLAQLTGFPVDFIKKELLLETNTLSLNELRDSMVKYLNKTIA